MKTYRVFRHSANDKFAAAAFNLLCLGKLRLLAYLVFCLSLAYPVAAYSSSSHNGQMVIFRADRQNSHVPADLQNLTSGSDLHTVITRGNTSGSGGSLAISPDSVYGGGGDL